MNNFAELARIVTNYKSKKIDLLYGESVPADNKYQKLAQSLTEKPNLTEEEAEAIIGSDRNSSSFRMFRLRFREKLINSLFLSDIELITNYARSITSLNKNIYCVRLLLLISARSTAIELAEQTLKKAIDFQLADVVIYCARILREHQKHNYDIELFDYYSNVVKNYFEIQQAENKASEYYEAFVVHNGNKHVFNKEYLNIMSVQILEIEELLKNHDTYQLGLNYYRLLAAYKFGLQDYEGALNTWNDAIKFIERFRQFEYESRIGEILLYKMNIFLYLHNYAEGLKCAEECRSVYKSGTNNWFTYNEFFFILALHTQNYKQAGLILEEVTKNPQFKFKTDKLKERWKIFEAYYFILLKAGVAEKYSNSVFRFSSFLNSVSIHSKDKKGYNASILIVEILYHLLNKEHHIITDKIEALKRYTKRHFEDGAEYRSHIFLQMLIECEKYKFEKDTVLKKTKKLEAQLISTQFSYITSLDGIEIVPFTDLWGIVCQCLD